MDERRQIILLVATALILAAVAALWCTTKTAIHWIYLLSTLLLCQGGTVWLLWRARHDNHCLRQMLAHQHLRLQDYELALQQCKRYVCRYDISSHTVCATGKQPPFASVLTQLPEDALHHGLIDADSAAEYCDFFAQLESGKLPLSTVIKFNLPGTGARWLQHDATTLFDCQGRPQQAVISYYDITDWREKELELIRRSERDALTGVLNRDAFQDKLSKLLQTTDQHGQHAFLIIDVDFFKQINDTLGHAAGDRVLAETVQRIGGVLRRHDLIGRLGGDEFMLYLHDLAGDTLCVKKVMQICNAVQKQLSPDLRISVSIGVSFYPQDGDCFEQLYQKADKALYRAKSKGRNCCEFYRPPTEKAIKQ